GTFMIDTCAGSDHFTSACETTAGAHDIIVYATEAGSAGTHIDILGTRWIIPQLTPTCAPPIGGPPAGTTGGSWGSSGSDGSPRFYWGIERADGTCESVPIMVTRM